jgi:PIN domain nuclease of toxin-antitoxin system
MRVLLDAHSFLWWVIGSTRLSAVARQAIAAEINDVLVSVCSLWEIAIKRSLGKLHFPHVFEDVLRDEAFEFLPITYGHLHLLESLPFHHRDPFDRLLIAQALAERIPIVTNDESFAAYGIETLW